MPKLFGLNLVGVIVASVVFYMVGWLWYGMLFENIWLSAQNLTKADFEGSDATLSMAGGFVITVMQVIGIGLVLKWKGAASVGAAVQTALIIWLLFALPFSSYAYLYAVTPNMTLLMVDASHLLVGWMASAIILSLLK